MRPKVRRIARFRPKFRERVALALVYSVVGGTNNRNARATRAARRTTKNGERQPNRSL